LANPHPILQGGPLFSMAKAVFIPPAELVVFLRLSTQQRKARSKDRAFLAMVPLTGIEPV
ncbi:hypothetical protein, partial [Gemmiger formicilis]|uniref:hypothetical protein n=1 Tax=Gemmiger formicilis TaxID=745368 RepID=UPI0019581EB4